ncbi:MAG: L-ribulose-5-phosphate 3-epimerase [Solobacterium sp.]|nr:L-ribulose-5-phosphate 3-epimerase [Solobacterium sp.]
MRPYLLGIYEKAMPSFLTWKEKMICAKEAGFDYIEISIDETDDKLSRLEWTEQERSEFIDLMRGMQMPVRSICLSGHRKYPFGSHDESVRARSMEIMEKAVVFAHDLGIRTIQLAGYDVYYEEGDEQTRAMFLENLKKAAGIAAVYGIVLGFETMETDFMNTVAKAMAYVKKVDSPYLHVYPDLGNITNACLQAGTSVTDDLETGRGHLVAMHLKETVPGVFREVPFGSGHVDFEAGINKAWELGVRRYLTEFWYTGEENWKEIVKDANDRMRLILDRVSGGETC